MFCSKCGNELPNEAKFCAACGNTIELPKKKKKGALIGIIAGVTAIAVAACAVGGWFLLGNKETVYVCTAKKVYDKNGTLYSITQYEYDDHGRLLSTELDRGENEEVWNDILGIFEYGNWSNPDGKTDSYYEYEYDKYGNMTRMAYQYMDADKPTVEEWEYEYDKKQIQSATVTSNPGTEFEGRGEYEFEYEDGKLVSVDIENHATGKDISILQAKYDSKGRITQSIHVMKECTLIYDYEYDKKGNLTEASVSTAPGRGMVEAGADPLESAKLQNRADYEYDSKGRLTEADGTEYTYDGKKLVAIGDEYEFRYNGKKLVSGKGPDGDYTFDKNGNLTEVEQENGETIRYEYKKMRLSKANAAAHYQQVMVNNHMHPSGSFGGSMMDWRFVEMPANPEIFANPAYFAWRR